ncbi:hypothetical protein E4U35_005679 [Claviceps purpurea]|nr:hypothetical protein E4U28_001844 [Claviceps purpurea]KAG6145712.1 hypothetical protein E4U38_004906 [Claviceps purpurea]KAG6160418.1 hypothetical protein E4U37_000370 [Claviceps purpurea]KAG6171332.1 hypothetical protein E4U11_000705 [Claviceps purpurea]KAG6173590.1 hypothetical protein E4U51_004966 [Claviceps purpurea]
MSQNAARILSHARVVFRAGRCLSSPSLSLAARRVPVGHQYLASRASIPRYFSSPAEASSPEAAASAEEEIIPASRYMTPPATKTPEEQASGPWLMRRTPSGQMPIYKQFKKARQYRFILLKKVEGDVLKFVDDLAEGTGIPRDEMAVVPKNQFVEIKGDDDRFVQIRNWLLEQGF